MNNVKKVLLLALCLSSNIFPYCEAVIDVFRKHGGKVELVESVGALKVRSIDRLQSRSQGMARRIFGEVAIVKGDLYIVPAELVKIKGQVMVEVNGYNDKSSNWNVYGIITDDKVRIQFPYFLPTKFFEGKKEGDIIVLMVNINDKKVCVIATLSQRKRDLWRTIKGNFEDVLNKLKENEK